MIFFADGKGPARRADGGKAPPPPERTSANEYVPRKCARRGLARTNKSEEGRETVKLSEGQGGRKVERRSGRKRGTVIGGQKRGRREPGADRVRPFIGNTGYVFNSIISVFGVFPLGHG